ncbi:putative 54S ribosomal protein L31, mitochondrial precursor [Nadsonia fulvescens var. elongata DSM 6958]|uniref:Large ribosomal subunit protein mL60 n=1 Tax=Nadsonia fulvescens var. elongata DSM 6958 TaxID=857566 RepID=A0A1E3PQW0_9ASCO|nr:putative 54S ribosomal protein L31, mitochondrial precursor [Nadsonia fulvescens var. elongata DSM 6958]
MFGPFRASMPTFGGLLWKNPWRMSKFQKYRQRKRMQNVDNTIDLLSQGLEKLGLKKVKVIENFKASTPKESEMSAKDKYTVFHKGSKGYRKGIHKVPKWTRLTERIFPKGF